jgi:hypothetical protein
MSIPSLPVTWLFGEFLVYRSRVQLCWLNWRQAAMFIAVLALVASYCHSILFFRALKLFFFFFSSEKKRKIIFQHWKLRARQFFEEEKKTLSGVVH